MEFFYYQNGRRIGPIDANQLKTLALEGKLAPDTPIERDGKIYPARKVKGLEFPPDPFDLPPVHPVEPAPEPDPVPEPEPPAPSRAPSPYPVRVVREPRSYTKRQRAERLERASHALAAWGWLFLALGVLIELIGAGFIIYGLATDTPVEADAIDVISEGTIGVSLLIGGIHPFIFAEIMFFFAALGYKIASDD